MYVYVYVCVFAYFVYVYIQIYAVVCQNPHFSVLVHNYMVLF